MSNCIQCNAEFEFKNSKLFCSRRCKEQNKKGRKNFVSVQEKIRAKEAQEANRAMWKELNKTFLHQRKTSMERHYRVKYGLSLEQVEELRKSHNGLCDICGTDTPRGNFKKFHIDHIEGTHIIRGMLCNNCNMGIGFLKHDIEILAKAVEYLKRFKT